MSCTVLADIELIPEDRELQRKMMHMYSTHSQATHNFGLQYVSSNNSCTYTFFNDLLLRDIDMNNRKFFLLKQYF